MLDNKNIHNLKTPLTSLKMYIQIIKEKHKEEKDIQRYTKKMDNQVKKLIKMIDSLHED